MADGDDARGDVAGGTRMETYASGAELLGMKVESFRRLAFRKRWRRTKGNDGIARVAVPLDYIVAHNERHSRGATPDNAKPAAPDDARGVTGDTMVAELRRELDAQIEARARTEGERDAIQRQVTELQRKLGETEDRLAGEHEARIRAEGELMARRHGEARQTERATHLEEARDAALARLEAMRHALGQAEGSAAALQQTVRVVEARRQEAEERARETEALRQQVAEAEARAQAAAAEAAAAAEQAARDDHSAATTVLRHKAEEAELRAAQAEARAEAAEAARTEAEARAKAGKARSVEWRSEAVPVPTPRRSLWHRLFRKR